jgi:hypothetical protein
LRCSKPGGDLGGLRGTPRFRKQSFIAPVLNPDGTARWTLNANSSQTFKNARFVDDSA